MKVIGIEHVYHLEGGILKYFEEVGNVYCQRDCFRFVEDAVLTRIFGRQRASSSGCPISCLVLAGTRTSGCQQWRGHAVNLLAAPTQAQVAGHLVPFIIDDFNTTNLYQKSDPSQAGDNPTGVDSGNIVMGVDGGGGWTRTLSATLTAGDSVQTQVCHTCQAAHVIADAGNIYSRGVHDFRWSGGPSIILSGYHSFEFDFGGDLSSEGMLAWVEFTDEMGSVASSLITLHSGPYQTYSIALP